MGWTRSIIVICGLFASSLAVAGPSAEQLIRIGQLADAFPVAQAEARERPKDLDAQERLVDLAMTMGLANLVRPRFQEIVVRHPDDADAHYMMGRLALGAHEAESLYLKALELDPDHARAYMGLGAVHRAQGRMGAAEEAYQQALLRDRSLGEAWAGLGAALLVQGRVDDARANARQAVQAVPLEADPYIAVATLEPESAVSILRKGVSAMPDEPRLHTFLAIALLEQGQGKAALIEARAALDLSPGFASAELAVLMARAQIAKTLDGPGYRDLLIAQRLTGPSRRVAFDQLVERYPSCELIWLGRAQVRAAAGDANGSLDDLSRAAQLAPDEPEVQAAMGVALERRGRSSLALPWLYKALIARPDDASLTIATARAEQATGKPTEARARVVAGVGAHPYDARVALHAAGILSAQGDKSGAYIVLREALVRTADPRVVVALAAAARDAGYVAEAALILQRLGRVTGSEKVQALAAALQKEAQVLGQVPEGP